MKRISGVSSHDRLSLFLMVTAVVMPVCVVEICVMSHTSTSFSSVGIIVVFAMTIWSMITFTTCTEPLMCYK